MDSAPICYIDGLPNEVIRLVVSFISPYDTFAVGGRPYFSTILGARWLSRRFRMIVNDLAFWQNDTVDFVWMATHCGTLVSAAHLKELNLDNHPELETVLLPSLIPIDSADTLESFKLWEGEN